MEREMKWINLQQQMNQIERLIQTWQSEGNQAAKSINAGIQSLNQQSIADVSNLFLIDWMIPH